MAEDQNNSQGLVGQAHTAEGDSPPLSPPSTLSVESGGGSVVIGAGTKSRSIQRDDSPPRGPRTLLLRRSENGFGFTLRHFIVYPPESCCMLPGHERTRIDEPMDTIFVKQVRENSPAADAGLRTGDRVVSVDGKPTRGEQYAKVVQRIQQAGPWLRLLVVSKEDDILQRYFGETAHNPETNQRPRLRSPERNSHKQRRSVSMIPSLSARTRQSWVCSSANSALTPMSMPESDQPRNDFFSTRDQEMCYRSNEFTKEMQQVCSNNGKTNQPTRNVTCRKPLQDVATCYESVREKVGLQNSPLQTVKDAQSVSNVQPTNKSMLPDTLKSDKYDSFDKIQCESVYSRINTDQIYDKIKDPIYERVRCNTEEHHHHHHHHYHLQQQQHYQSHLQQHSNLTHLPLSRAEPQVPIYRSVTKRVSLRRTSEGSMGSSTLNNFDSANYDSAEAIRSFDQNSRLSIDSRRNCSPLPDNDSSAYDITSTLLDNETNKGRSGSESDNSSRNRNDIGNEISIGGSNIDDSVIMTRLRKSFEQKEEFLRRPSHPIGWFLPEENLESLIRNSNSATAIPREFYARPQKLQRQIWPPTDFKEDQQPLSSKPNPDQSRSTSGQLIASDKINCSNQNAQKFINNAADDMGGFIDSRNSKIDESIPCNTDDHRITSDWKELPYRQQQQQQAHRVIGKSNNFIGTLSKIQESIANTRILFSAEPRQTADSKNNTSSLPSSPGLEKKANEKFPILPQGLQIVSKRAKQFESGRLMSDDDEPTSDRTNLYRSELSRLSSKRSVPNVAVRKREFESKAETRDIRRIPMSTRETKSLDTDTFNPKNMDEGNMVQPRIRSNSVESWELINDGGSSQTNRQQRPQQQQDTERRRSTKENDVGYVDATNGFAAKKTDEKMAIRKHDMYEQVIETNQDTLSDKSTTQSTGVVFRRHKNTQIADEDRATRRVSYLKATWGERMHVDSDLELSDSEPIHASRSNNTCVDHNRNSNVKDTEQVEREGPLHVKFTVLDGKRSSDRSWKQVWGVLRGPILFFYKDRQNQSPSLTSDGENVAQSVDVRCSVVDIAEDYTKRKHVLRLANPNAEVLLQTEDAASMALWLRALHEHAAAEKPSEVVQNSTLKQQAVPQTPCPASNFSTCQTITNTSSIMIPSNGSSSGSGTGTGGGGCTTGDGTNGSQRLSPLPGHKGIKKLTSFRNRSPTGQSPINKTRKSSQTIESLVSPKTKTWKGRVAKQLRRMHGQSGPPSSPTTQLPPEGATFRVPLELCPPSSFSEFVPLIIEMCTSIVEARGLEVVGIYRVPGNTAAISHLTDSVNKGFEHINLQDPRWSDVNVISSLLKSFFRQLPDSLLTAELYPMFIDADKVEDPQRRMTTIRKLLRDLPEHHFETLKYLMFHLKKIVNHSEINKMEAKNLAIVFGPTLVRASGSRDNMVTMVTDMSHQCRIVESLLNNVDWFFSDDDLDDLSRLSVNLSLPADTTEIDAATNSNHNLLLNNIQKVEGVREMASAKDIVSSIISAANRKIIQRRRKVQDETDNDNHEIEKLRTKQETENLPNRQSMALNERQCSVSEIVSMHENKNQSNRCINRPSIINRIIENSVDANSSVGSGGGNYDGDGNGRNGTNNNDGDGGGGNDSSNRNRDNGGDGDRVVRSDNTLINNDDIGSERSRRYLNPLVESIESTIQDARRSTVSSASESSSRLSSETGLSFFDVSSIVSNDTKHSNDEVTIRTYAGLSATTQERIRRFEQETKAMLQRDQNRQRREAEKREEERRRIEMEWQLAKSEMENDDLLDSIVDTTMTPSYHRLSAMNERLSDNSFLDMGSRSTTRIPPVSIAVQQQPTTIRRVSQCTDKPITAMSSDTLVNNFVKKMKTDTESIEDQQSTLSPIRHDSLESDYDIANDASQSPFSPTSQHRKLVSSDVSDDGSDLLTSLTTTFDRKWRSLLNSSSQTDRESVTDGASFSDEDNPLTKDCRNERSVRNESEKEKNEEKMTAVTVQSLASCSIETYRDPSLHKSAVEKYRLVRQKNTAPEKDTDSSLTINYRSTERSDNDIPDNDRSAVVRRKIELNREMIESNLMSNATQQMGTGQMLTQKEITNDVSDDFQRDGTESNYSHKLEKFESLTKCEVRSRLKRSESLNKRSENACSKLKRSESLNKHSCERVCSPTNGKLKRSESLNKHSERSDSPNSKLKRSESLTKTEKTECNISKRRQSVRKDSTTKLKRKNGMPERSIKRRHTVGGTKDFDKVHWLDNRLQVETERAVKNEYRPKKSQLRTSSPDLSTARIGLTDTSFLIEVSFRGPSNVVLNVTNTRPQSLPDTSLPSKVYKVPLESHV